MTKMKVWYAFALAAMAGLNAAAFIIDCAVQNGWGAALSAGFCAYFAWRYSVEMKNDS